MPATRRPTSARGTDRESGQVIVVFTISLVVLISLVGLALDAGSTFSQRRGQQAASDLAALAAANDYLLNNSDTTAIAAAQQVATENGYTNGVGGTSVAVAIDTSNGAEVTVGISSDHNNSFLGVVGMPTWGVSTTAVALAGFPDTAFGASPFVFSAEAFEGDGTPKYQTPTDFGESNGDAPTSELDFAWTNFGTGNVDSSEVRDIIRGDLVIDKTLTFGEYIGQHNNGNHSTLYDDVNTYLADTDLPVAVTDSNGNFVGWSMFHVISATGGSAKNIRGYFYEGFTSGRLTVSSCSFLNCPRYLGWYTFKLVG
jgi:Flp pilus assembly protein TadG